MNPRPSTRVVIVHGDDWQGLYLDGFEVYQHHKVRLQDMKRDLPADIPLSEISEWYDDLFIDYLRETGAFPRTLTDLENGIEAMLNNEADDLIKQAGW